MNFVHNTGFGLFYSTVLLAEYDTVFLFLRHTYDPGDPSIKQFVPTQTPKSHF